MTAPASALSFPKVLVVDDDEPFARALCSWLSELGYRGESVGTLELAAERLTRAEYAVVMLDLHLPDAHGHALLRQLNRSGYSVPVVVMSGGAEISDVVHALRERAADFLGKPFELDHLASALDRALATGRSTVPRLAAPSTTAVAVHSVGHDEPTQRPVPVTIAASARSQAPPKPLLDEDQLRLPVLDPKIASLHEFLSRDDYNMQEVADTVGRDAAVTAGVLRAANTAHYNRGTTIESLRDACVRIGPRRVVGIALEVSVQSQFQASRQPFGRILDNMWRNAIVTSRVVAELARGLRRSDADTLQVAALLHNIGELLTVKLLSQRPDPEELTEEQIAHEVSRNHEKVGRKLAEAWKLPHAICRLAGAHHRVPPGAESADEKVVRHLVLAGWALAISAGYSYLAGHEAIELDDYLTPLGLDHETAIPFIEQIADWEV